jgi:hypothetical protein
LNGLSTHEGLAMNITIATNPIVAIDLGKYKSVACVFLGGSQPGEIRFGEPKTE